MLRPTMVATLLVLSGATLLLASARPDDGSAPLDSAADITFTGRVVDSRTLAPLHGAVVVLAGTRWSTVTGSTGDYRLVVPDAAVPPGDLRLLVQMVGYEQAEQVIRLNESGFAKADFSLVPSQLISLQVRDRGKAQESAAVGDVSISPSFVAVGYGGIASAPASMPHPGWNTESYSYIAENTFRAARDAPLSTFSIDVDRASYSNVRRFILEGQLPPVDAVRIEEMVNYFRYDYPTRQGDHPFAVTTELAAAPWHRGHQILRIGLASEPIDMSSAPPSNFVFLIDVSGSMQTPDKLPLVKQSLRMLVEELRAGDRVAIVVYAGAAGLVLPSTPGDQKERILDAIEALEAGGSTAGGAGLRLAYRVAAETHIEGGNNRVILATDGDFNVGVSSDAEMVRLVTEHRAQGTYLTVLGFGTGNLKDSKMEQMAQHGNGNYAYIDSLLEARKVLVTEMGGTLVTVAADVKLQVEFNPAVVAAYRLIGYENRLLAAEDFNDDRRDAGELGAGHVVTALYEVVPVGAEPEVAVGRVDPLRYQTPAPASTGATGEVAFVRVRYKRPAEDRSLLLEQAVPARVGEPSPDLRFATAVAAFGMILRDSEHRGTADIAQVLDLTSAGLGRDPNGYRHEFVRLVERYRSLVEPDRQSSDDR